MRKLHVKSMTIRLNYRNFAEDNEKAATTVPAEQEIAFHLFEADVAAPSRRVRGSFSMRGKERQFLDHTLQSVPSLENVTLYLSRYYQDKHAQVFSLARLPS